MNLNMKTRPGWTYYVLLAVLALAGLGGGLYLSLPNESAKSPPLSTKESAPLTHRFALTAADVKERNEAPELAVDASGRVYLVWASQTGPEQRTLYRSFSDDVGGSFSPPREVARTGIFKALSQMKGKTITRDSKMAPHVVAHGNVVYLAWTESLPDNTGVRTVVAASIDRGATFGAPVPVHSGDGSRSTYTGLGVGPDGTLLCSWLDNRDKSQQAYASVRRPGQDAFELEQLVHAGDDSKGVCPCCPTTSLIGPDGTCYVAFRNVADGYRDIAIGRKIPKQTTYDLFPIVTPTWKWSGCPHDGAALAIVGDTLHVLWMDAHTGPQRCYHAAGSRNDMKFKSTELPPMATGTQGNPKLHADVRGTLHAVWEESFGTEPGDADHKHDHAAPVFRADSGRAIMHAVWSSEASRFGPARAVAAKSGAFQMRPAVLSTPDGRIVVAWNELAENGKSLVVTTIAADRRTNR